MCQMHWTCASRGHRPDEPSSEVAFFRHVTENGDGCWVWDKPDVKGGGYGRFRVGVAHRWSYELFVGPVPQGLTLDHLCRNRACVNPAHLDPVPQRVNTLRGVGFAATNARKTHCVHGHEFTAENTYITKRGQRYCRPCAQRRSAVWAMNKRGS